MISNKTVTLTLLSTLISCNLHAESYLGGKLGISDNCTVDSQCTNDNFAGSVLFGYRFTPYVSTEYSADFLGKYETNIIRNNSLISLSGDLLSLTFTPKFTLPVTEKLGLYSKVGAAFMIAEDASDLVATISGGAEYKLTNNTSVTAEYQYYKGMSDGFIQDMDTKYFTLGVIYRLKNSVNFEDEVSESPLVLESEELLLPTKDSEDEVELNEELDIYSVHPEQSTTLYFSINKTVPSDWRNEEIESLLETLKSYPEAHLNITGYSDDIGRPSYNLKLTKERAQAIADIFISRGIDASRFVVEGKGEENPIADNHSEQGRTKNRRVEVSIPSFSYQQ